MANEHTAFWLALLDQGFDAHKQARLWNGYLGWKLPPQTVDPPDGGWPELTQEEHEILKTVAEEHGGYPEFTKGLSMKFSGHTFSDKANFSGLILIGSNFNNVRFKATGVLFDKTRFYGQAEVPESDIRGNCALAQRAVQRSSVVLWVVFQARSLVPRRGIQEHSLVSRR